MCIVFYVLYSIIPKNRLLEPPRSQSVWIIGVLPYIALLECTLVIVVFAQVIDIPGNFVEPTIITGLSHDSAVVLKESFVPVLFVMNFNGDIDEAIKLNNEVDQGLTSSIFTQNLSNLFRWMG